MQMKPPKIHTKTHNFIRFFNVGWFQSVQLCMSWRAFHGARYQHQDVVSGRNDLCSYFPLSNCHFAKQWITRFLCPTEPRTKWIREGQPRCVISVESNTKRQLCRKKIGHRKPKFQPVLDASNFQRNAVPNTARCNHEGQNGVGILFQYRSGFHAESEGMAGNRITSKHHPNHHFRI